MPDSREKRQKRCRFFGIRFLRGDGKEKIIRDNLSKNTYAFMKMRSFALVDMTIQEARGKSRNR